MEVLPKPKYPELPFPDVVYQIPAQWNLGNKSEISAYSEHAMRAYAEEARQDALKLALKSDEKYCDLARHNYDDLCLLREAREKISAQEKEIRRLLTLVPGNAWAWAERALAAEEELKRLKGE